MGDVKINGNDLVLRPVSASDFEVILKWENDSANWIQSGITTPYTEDEIKTYVSKHEDLIVDGQTRYMIDLKNKETIGCVDLFDFDKLKMMASVGLLIDGMHRGNGYGSIVLDALGNIAKKYHQLNTLKALILADNEVSVHLFKKSGFKPDDTKAAVYHYNNQDYLQLAYFKDL